MNRHRTNHAIERFFGGLVILCRGIIAHFDALRNQYARINATDGTHA